MGATPWWSIHGPWLGKATFGLARKGMSCTLCSTCIGPSLCSKWKTVARNQTPQLIMKNLMLGLLEKNENANKIYPMLTECSLRRGYGKCMALDIAQVCCFWAWGVRVYVVLEHGPLSPFLYPRITLTLFHIQEQHPRPLIPCSRMPLFPWWPSLSHGRYGYQGNLLKKFEQIFILGKAHSLGLYPTPSKSVTCKETLLKYNWDWLFCLHAFRIFLVVFFRNTCCWYPSPESHTMANNAMYCFTWAPGFDPRTSWLQTSF